MPSTLIVSDGGTYSSLNAALAAADTGDTISIEGTWAARDTTACSLSDATLTIVCDADSKHVGRPWETGDTHYQHRVTSGHAFTVTSTGTVSFSDLDIQNASTGTSDEIFRSNVGNTFFAERCLLGFDSRNDQQDIYYNENVVDATFESCIFYNVHRGVVDGYNINNGSVININSCTGFAIGSSSGSGSRTGLVGVYATNTVTVNIANTIHDGTGANYPAISAINSATSINVHTLITTAAAIENGDGTVDTDTSNVLNASVDDSDTAGYYILINKTTSPYDLRLQDVANNVAIKNHSVESFTGTGLTLPITDVMGNTRVRTAGNIDIGAHAITGGGGDTSVSGTGVESSASVGSVGFTKGATVALTGASSTISIGSVGISAGASIALTGAESSPAVGSVTFTKSGSAGLTGEVSTLATGTIGISKGGSLSLTGVASTPAVGSVSASAGSTVSLTGIASTSEVGAVGFTKSGVIGLTGTESATSIDSVGFSRSGSIALSGEESTFSVGTVDVVSGVTIALTGTDATPNVGSFGLTKSGQIALSGESLSASVGTLAVFGQTVTTPSKRTITASASNRTITTNQSNRTIIS
jgi:hypothetical protein